MGAGHYRGGIGLHSETELGLNVVEKYNGLGDYIWSASAVSWPPTDARNKELGRLCLHILQSCLDLIKHLDDLGHIRAARVGRCANRRRPT